MNATILSNNEKHYPVLLKEILSIISPQNGGTFIDCTFGQGGYSKALLRYNNTNVIALDRDSNSKIIAEEIKQNYKDRFSFYNIKFSEIDKIEIKKNKIKAILFDLGYSYLQIKDPSKGLSFDSKGKLNMRLGLNDFSANEVINKLNQKDLGLIFKYFGEEKDSNIISKKIVKERAKSDLNTEKLVHIINSVKKKSGKIHNATKIFQAIRIFVNKEISELIYGLINATKVLKKGGILGVVTFHSLEDKIVKYFFKSLSENKSISRYSPVVKQADTLFNLIQKKPITPSEEELSENPPSRSAKFRYAIKKTDFYNFDTDIEEKFRNYIEIEKYGDKL